MPSQSHMRGGAMLIKFQARQRIRAMLEAYKEKMYDEQTTDEEADELLVVVEALESALVDLKEEEQ